MRQGRVAFVLFCSAVALVQCGDGSRLDQRVSALSCPEPVMRNARGEPRNAAGQVRFCWPGEANCFCDTDHDCYALKGYVPCTPFAMDAGGTSDARVDAVADVRADVRADTGADVRADVSDGASVCPETVVRNARGEPRNAAGQVRFCWPGEANCFCDADRDCYALAGYVPCVPPSSAMDAGGDVRDAAMDAPRDVALDARVDARVDVIADAVAVDAPVADGGAGFGQWGAVMPFPFPAVHAALLPDGRVILWPDDHDYNPHLWNPLANTFTDTGFMRTELHCAGESFLPDGRLFMTGGEPVDMSGAGYGVTDVNFFDAVTNRFTSGPIMRDLRWYPTNTVLPNGEVLVTAGTRTGASDANLIPEVYSVTTGLRSLTGASRELETYPFMFVAPNGLVFQAGPDPETQYIDPTGAGRWIPLTTMNAVRRIGGTGALYDHGKVLILGGSPLETGAPVLTAEVIDLNAATPRWTYTSPMARPRRDPTATLLPDGTVIVLGGMDGLARYVPEPEIWSPATGTFARMAPSSVGRAYHSVSLLMPDGRVLFAGGTDYLTHNNGQLFSPPYLFRGPRPVVTSAPARVGYGASFTVATPDAATVTGASWVRLGAVTHGFDQNQRINRLAIAPVAGGVQLTAPANAVLCPPGHYQLFLLNDRGVPSIGRVIQIL